jgi:hypothetical protein
MYLAGEAISAYALGMVRFGSVRFFKDFGEPRTGLLVWSTNYGELWTGQLVRSKTVRFWFFSGPNYESDFSIPNCSQYQQC